MNVQLLLWLLSVVFIGGASYFAVKQNAVDINKLGIKVDKIDSREREHFTEVRLALQAIVLKQSNPHVPKDLQVFLDRLNLLERKYAVSPEAAEGD